MEKYISLAKDQSKLYSKIMYVIFSISLIIGLAIAYLASVTPELMVSNEMVIEASFNPRWFSVYATLSVLINILLLVIMKFFIQILEELTMQRFINFDILLTMSKDEEEA